MKCVNIPTRTASCVVPEVDNKPIQEQPRLEVIISVEKKNQMIEYAKKLHKKFPHMKKERLMRKVAEHFKVKLV